jgi:hypothetical protein
MKSIINTILKRFSKDPPKSLGRWNIDYCNVKIDRKIDLSNEDHCGPCGQYIIEKINLIKNEDKKVKPKIIPINDDLSKPQF